MNPRLFTSFGFGHKGAIQDECRALFAKIVGGRVDHLYNIPEYWPEHGFVVPSVPTPDAIEEARLGLDAFLHKWIGPPLLFPRITRSLALRGKWPRVPYFTLDIENDTLKQQWSMTSPVVKAAWKNHRRPGASLDLHDDLDGPSFEDASRACIKTLLDTCKRWGLAGTYAASGTLDSWPYIGLDGVALSYCDSALRLADFAYRPLHEPAAVQWPISWDSSVPLKPLRILQHNLRHSTGVVQPASEIRDAYETARSNGCALAVWADPDWFNDSESIRKDVAAYAVGLTAAMKGS